MQSADREQFDAHLGALCAGYNVPSTDLRREAYWVALQRMELPAFVRVVEYALGERGPDKIPTTKGIWALYHDLRRGRSAPASTQATTDPVPNIHPFVAFANRRLLAYLNVNGAASETSLAALVTAKNRIANSYRELSEGGEHVTPDEVAETLNAEFRRLWKAA